MPGVAAVTVAALAVAFVAAGCGGDDEQGVPTGTTQTATTTLTCTSEEGGYHRLDYPAGWHQERCAYFDPEEFEVPEATEFFDVAAIVSREPVGLRQRPRRPGLRAEQAGHRRHGRQPRADALTRRRLVRLRRRRVS